MFLLSSNIKHVWSVTIWNINIEYDLWHQVKFLCVRLYYMVKILLTRVIKFNSWQDKCWLISCFTIWHIKRRYRCNRQNLKELKQWVKTHRHNCLYHGHRFPVTHTWEVWDQRVCSIWNHFTYFLSEFFSVPSFASQCWHWIRMYYVFYNTEYYRF